MKYTIVIVAHQTDYEVLCVQARSLSKYISTDLIEQIIVIENQKLDNHAHLFDQYRDLKSIVTLVEGHEIAPPEAFQASGWFTQQILKLLIAKHITTQRYIVLDAKNIMVYPFTTSLLERNDKPRMFLRDFRTHTSLRWLRNTLHYFNLPESAFAGNFVSTTTPFIFVTDLVKQMIEYVEQREQTSFATTFLMYELTEFFLYAGYLIAFGKMDYDWTGKECKTVWDTIHSDEYVTKIIQQTKQHRLPFLSVQRRAAPLMSAEAKQMVLDFWQTRGIDGSAIFK